MPANEWYNNWLNSPYYHKLYFENNKEEAETFIANLINYLKPAPGSRMLDAACGKGRQAQMLASHGFNVTGVDFSTDNIQEAHSLEQDNLHFYLHDIRLPFWINYFNFAFNFFATFGFYNTRRDHENAVRTIAASLKPGGIVVFDYLNTHYAEDNLVHNEVKKIGDTAYEIHRWQDDTHFFKKMIITDPHLSQPLELTEKVMKFSLGDFNDMLSFHKMQVTEVFGNYNLDSYHIRNTPRLIVCAQKLIS